MATIKDILEDMRKAVDENRVCSPVDWLNWAFGLNVLWQDLKTEKTKFEMLYKSEIVDLIEKGRKISEADRIVEARSDNYKMFKYLQGRDEIIENFILLAKKRASIEQQDLT